MASTAAAKAPAPAAGAGAAASTAPKLSPEEQKKAAAAKAAEDKKLLTAFQERTNAVLKAVTSGAANTVLQDLDAWIALMQEAGDLKFPTPDCDKHFYTNILTKGTTAILTRNYHTHDPRIIPKVQEALQATLMLIIRKKDCEWQQLSDTLDVIFDDTKGFYMKDGAEKPDSFRETMSDVKALADWRKTVAFPQWLDVYANNKWRPAQIQEESEKQFRVAFDYGANEPSEWIDRDSPRLAPHWSRAKDYFGQWRRDLVPGSRVDALDPMNKWYCGHVIEVQGDFLHLNYDGWAAKFNEWISRSSDRLAEWRTHGIIVENGGRESNAIPHHYGERSLHDLWDPEGVVALWRGKEWGPYTWAANVNYFGENGGFDMMFARFKVSQPLLPMASYRKYVEAMARVANVLAKPWCRVNMPRLKEATYDTFVTWGDNELRFLAKEPLEAITNCVDKLLSRWVGWTEQISIVEKFNMEIALRRFRCGNVERQINGLTAIGEATTRCRKHNSGWLQQSTFLEWCLASKVLEDCYGKNTHAELMKRSIDLLKFYAEFNKIDKSHIDLIWGAVERAIRNSDDGTLKILYKVLEDVAWQLEQGLIDYLFEKLKQTPMVEYMSPTVTLIKEMARWTYKAGPAAGPKAMELLWTVFQDGSGANYEIMVEARRHLEEVLGMTTQKQARVPYLNMAIANVKAGRSVPCSLLLVQSIIDHFGEQQIGADEPNKEKLLLAIDKEHKLLDMLFDDLKRFKAHAKKLITERGVKGKDINALVISSQQQFMHHIRDRYGFLYYALTNSPLVLDKARIDDLWAASFTDSFTGAERENGYKWLKRACGVRVTARNFFVFDDDTTDYVFRKFVKDVDPATISKSGFECFERFFVYCNERAKKLETKGEEITVLDFNGLEGLEYLWKVALECKRVQGVVPKAVALLNRVHERLADSLRAQVGAIRNKYIAVVMNHAKASLAQEKKLDAAAFAQRIERCISLLTNQLDASEGKGTAGLRSHGAQARGQLLEIGFQFTDEKRSAGAPLKQLCRVYSNDTLWDLRAAIGKALGFIPERVRLFTAGKQFGMEMNAKPLRELKLKATGEMLLVKKHNAEGAKYPLSDAKGLTTHFTQALREIFKGYAKNQDGTMSIEDMASYIMACGAGEHNARPERMAQIFHSYGDAQTHARMDPDGFVSFYRQAAEERPDAVWNDLVTHGYRWDLRKEEDVVKEELALMRDEKHQLAEQKLLPRYLLSHANEYFHVLFDALNLDEHLAQQMWTLVQRLPTNPDLHRKLYSLDIVNSAAPEWDDLLDSRSAYKLLYSLQILESLTEPTEETEDEKAQKAEERAAWRKKFLLSGGFQHLYSILVNRKGFIANPNTQLRKSCQQLLLKMLYNFIISAMAVGATPGQTNTQLLDLFEKVRLENEAAAKEPDAMAADVPPVPTVAGENVKDDAALAAALAAGQEPGSVMSEDSIQGGLSSANEGKGSEDDEKKKAEAKEKKEKEAKDKADKEAKEKADAEKKRRDALPEFHKLVRQMSSNFAGKLLSFVSFTDLQHCLLSTIHACATGRTGAASSAVAGASSGAAGASGASMPPEDAATVEFAINLWVSIVLFQPDTLLPALYKLAAAPSVAVDAKADAKSGAAAAAGAGAAAAITGADLIRAPLLCPISSRVRKQFACALYQICTNTTKNEQIKPTGAAFFLDYFLKQLPTGNDNRDLKLECEEYFSVVSKLLADAMGAGINKPPTPAAGADAKDAKDAKAAAAAAPTPAPVAAATWKQADLQALGLRLVGALVTHVSAEASQGSADRVDKVLAGVMQLLTVLVTNDESLRTSLAAPAALGAAGNGDTLIKYMFTACLFGELPDPKAVVPAGQTRIVLKQKPGVPKCKTKPARGIAYQLLSSLCRNTPANYQQLLELVMQQHQTIPKIPSFDYNPEKLVVSSSGYVGLRNMGSTCYMNSLMQQLYMIPKMRYGVLLAPDAEVAGKPDDAKTRDDSLLYQLQTMFGYLATSEKQAFDTAKFCASYKDEKGAPINPRIQQDVQEFFGTLVDRLEKRLKPTPQAGLFKHLFGGQLVNQLICQNPACKNVRENTEPYLTTSMQVKGRNALAESLETYINGEILSGVNCPACQQKVDTQRRACFGSLANVMVFHLKRFELNYETFQHEKLNNKFEFPFTLNLEPFTKEGLLRRQLEAKRKDFPALNIPPKYSVHPQSYYEYQLVGIIVHTGSAQAGHYYSFIKDRNKPAPAIGAGAGTEGGGPVPAKGDGSTWLEFNDNVVRPFDTTKIEDQCFGGEQEVVEKGWTGYDSYRKEERAKNAYMLLYERNPNFKREVIAKPPLISTPSLCDVKTAPPAAVAVTAPAAGAGADAKSAPTAAADNKDAPATATLDHATATALANLKAMIDEANGVKPAAGAAALQVPAATTDAKAVAVDVVTGGVSADAMAKPLTAYVPPAVLKASADDNASFAHDRQIFNGHYFRFMNDVVKIASYPDVKEYDPPATTPNPTLPLVQLSLKFALDTIARAGDNAILPEYLNSLCGQLNGNIPAARWVAEYLAYRPAMCSELIMGVREKSIRKAFMDLIVHLFKLLSPFEDKFFHDEVKGDAELIPGTAPVQDPQMAAAVAVAAAKDAKDSKIGQYDIPALTSAKDMRPKASTLRLMCTLISVLNDAYKCWMKFEHYWEVFYNFALIGPNQRKALADRKMITTLADFMLGEYSPLWEARKKLPTMGNRMVTPVWWNCVRTLNLLVRSSCTDADFKQHAGALPPTMLANGALAPFPISDTDRKLLTSPALYIHSFGPLLVNESLTEVLIHWCWENETFSGVVIDMLLSGIDRSNERTVKPWWDILDPLCKLKDKLQQRRLHMAMAPNKGVLYKIWYYRQKHEAFTFAAMMLLAKTLETNAEWVKFSWPNRQREWGWIENWLRSYINRRYGHLPPSPAEKKEREEGFARWCAVIQKLGGELYLGDPKKKGAGKDGKDGKAEKDGKVGGGPGGLEPIATSLSDDDDATYMGGAITSDDYRASDDNSNKRARGNGGVEGQPGLSVQGTGIGSQPPAQGGGPAGGPAPGGAGGGAQPPNPNPHAAGGARDDSVLDDMRNRNAHGVRFGNGGGAGGGSGGVRGQGAGAFVGPLLPGQSVMGGEDDGALPGTGGGGGGGTGPNWACPICTFENPGWRSGCEMCGELKKV